MTSTRLLGRTGKVGLHISCRQDRRRCPHTAQRQRGGRKHSDAKAGQVLEWAAQRGWGFPAAQTSTSQESTAEPGAHRAPGGASLCSACCCFTHRVKNPQFFLELVYKTQKPEETRVACEMSSSRATQGNKELQKQTNKVKLLQGI